jgi:hypothetical protein
MTDMTPPGDHLDSRDNTGVQAIALLNIEMIDIGGPIEVDVGNSSPEAGTPRHQGIARIIVDDL